MTRGWLHGVLPVGMTPPYSICAARRAATIRPPLRRNFPKCSVGMRGIPVAARTIAAVESAEQFLEQARESSALRLAQFFFLTGQPRHLDHGAFAFEWQMSMEGIVGAFEHDEIAVKRLDFRRGQGVDGVDAVEEAQAAIARIRP